MAVAQKKTGCCTLLCDSPVVFLPDQLKKPLKSGFAAFLFEVLFGLENEGGEVGFAVRQNGAVVDHVDERCLVAHVNLEDGAGDGAWKSVNAFTSFQVGMFAGWKV